MLSLIDVHLLVSSSYYSCNSWPTLPHHHIPHLQKRLPRLIIPFNSIHIHPLIAQSPPKIPVPPLVHIVGFVEQLPPAVENHHIAPSHSADDQRVEQIILVTARTYHIACLADGCGLKAVSRMMAPEHSRVTALWSVAVVLHCGEGEANVYVV